MNGTSDKSIHDPFQPIRERDLAERWKKSLRTLQRWRAMGYGPPFIRLGAGIYYRLGDVRAFEARMCQGGERDQ